MRGDFVILLNIMPVVERYTRDGLHIGINNAHFLQLCHHR